ncbi:MAG: DUF4252 domain-containing protein [Bryobacteraceae bacterium]
MNKRVGGLLLLLALAAPAQEIKSLKALDALEAKASERVNVTLDANLLQMATKFLSQDNSEEAKVKKAVSKLKGVYVRGFEFEQEGAYSKADVDAIRKELKTPDWSRIVDTFSKKDGESAEVYLHLTKGLVTGLAVLVAGPKELTVVNLVGSIDIEELSDLGGKFGIPEMERKKALAPPKAPQKD